MKKSSWQALAVLALAGSLVIGLSACENKNAASGKAPGNTAANAPATATSTASARSVNGMRIEDVREGTGQVAEKSNSVSVNYLGTLASNGSKFDSSYDRNEPITFKLGSGKVIEGWEKGIEGMKVGGKRILTIPPNMAYGEEGYPPVIPPNSTLKFEVELVDVK